MDGIRVGIDLPQQYCTVDELRGAWHEADRAGFDSLWLWDHFFSLTDDPEGLHFEA